MQSSLSSLQAALQRDGMAGASQKSCLKEISLGLDLISRERVKPARKKRTDLPLSLHSLEDFQVPEGFPYLFRGALDVRATTINMEMKVAAANALAALAQKPVPDDAPRFRLFPRPQLMGRKRCGSN